MRPKTSPLDLNHSPERSVIGDKNQWVRFPSAELYCENHYNNNAVQPLMTTESWPPRRSAVKDGTAAKLRKRTISDICHDTQQNLHQHQLIPQNPSHYHHPWNSCDEQQHLYLSNNHNTIINGVHPQGASAFPWELSVTRYESPILESTVDSDRFDKRQRKSMESSEEEVAANGRYACRFCPQVFDKSQALGGHMNRHRPEREQEQIQQAREILEKDNHYALLFQSTSPEMSKLTCGSTCSSSSMHNNKPSLSLYQSPLAWNPSGYLNTAYGALLDSNLQGYAKKQDLSTSENDFSSRLDPNLFAFMKKEEINSSTIPYLAPFAHQAMKSHDGSMIFPYEKTFSHSQLLLNHDHSRDFLSPISSTSHYQQNPFITEFQDHEDFAGVHNGFQVPLLQSASTNGNISKVPFSSTWSSNCGLALANVDQSCAVSQHAMQLHSDAGEISNNNKDRGGTFHSMIIAEPPISESHDEEDYVQYEEKDKSHPTISSE